MSGRHLRGLAAIEQHRRLLKRDSDIDPAEAFRVLSDDDLAAIAAGRPLSAAAARAVLGWDRSVEGAR